MNKFNRRNVILTGLGLLAASAGVPALAAAPAAAELRKLEARLGGRVGLAALDTASGRTLSWRADERFAMCSSFKWLLAAAILAQVEQGKLALDQMISYSAKALLAHSPVTSAHLHEGGMTVSALCAGMIATSDNGAANLLLEKIGGPAGYTRYLREIGDTVTRLDRNEPTLNANLPGDPRDTTTPDAMVKTMQRVLVGDALQPSSRQKLLDWMRKSETGANRLKAGLPAGWTEGDKTGTGSHGATIDNAIIWPPGRPPILAAAYLSGSDKSIKMLEAAHAEMGRMVAAAFG
ncbi:MAG: class A beta-lactamase [Pseudomonadota bacterium]